MRTADRRWRLRDRRAGAEATSRAAFASEIALGPQVGDDLGSDSWGIVFMSNDAAAPRSIAGQVLSWLCWIVIAAFLVTKVNRFLQGASFTSEFDLDNPTL